MRELTSILSRCFLLAGIALILASCAPRGPIKIYPGEPRAASEVSVFRLDRGTSVTFYQMVERAGSMVPQPIGSTEGAHVQLLPGFYKAMVTFISDRTDYGYDWAKRNPTQTHVTTVSTEPAYIEFELKAGREYHLTIRRDAAGWRPEVQLLPEKALVSRTTNLWGM